MQIDIPNMRDRFKSAQSGKASHHTATTRIRPSLTQYDFLSLRSLSLSIRSLIDAVPEPTKAGRRPALDLGSATSPYRSILEQAGFAVETLDIDPESGADHVGTIEATGLPSDYCDLVICTQVLEHCDNPWYGVAEIARILKPGGFAVLSAPHVWFFHPHPHDHWRFTQEGLVRLCRSAGLEPRMLLSQGGTVLTVGQILNFLVYGMVGRWGAPFYFGVNLVTTIADRLIPNELFAHNFACLARREVSAVR